MAALALAALAVVALAVVMLTVVMLVAPAIVSPAAAQQVEILSLYRSSDQDPLAAEHVATFDSRHGVDQNADNCWLAARLFQEQPGGTVRYWCAPGRPAANED